MHNDGNLLSVEPLNITGDSDLRNYIPYLLRGGKRLVDHSVRVAYLTRSLGQALGLEADTASSIACAAFFHDIGMIAIEDSIVNKSEPLTAEDWGHLKEHTTLGARFLSYTASEEASIAMDIALCHHEKFTGEGYPNGLAGKEIPLPARVVAVADQYDALRSKRPYKQALSHETTLLTLVFGDERTSPEHLDPEVLAAFLTAEGEIGKIWDEMSEATPPLGSNAFEATRLAS
ncbi:MAG: HD domain-containing protein [Deltaproteobacteria bacterium]|nr:HD domain-containing protein [Deltaproteobacteria bacterium]